jgi:hypothetical protein
MQTQLFTTEKDFKDWQSSTEHPNGTNAKADLEQVTPPVAYPAMIVWEWSVACCLGVGGGFDGRDWITYVYVYSNEFPTQTLLGDKSQ